MVAPPSPTNACKLQKCLPSGASVGLVNDAEQAPKAASPRTCAFT